MRIGLIIVDHGSRVAESNRLLEQLAAAFAERFAGKYQIVEPAHMSIAEPSIASAYKRCVDRGADRIIVAPCFIAPGRHSSDDIPRLTAEAAAVFPHTSYRIAPCLGIDDRLLDLLEKRISEAGNAAHSSWSS